MYTYDKDFSDMELGFRLGYLLIALTVVVLFFYRLRADTQPVWTFEQKATGVLLIALVFLNSK